MSIIQKYLDEICDILNFERGSVTLYLNGTLLTTDWYLGTGNYYLCAFGSYNRMCQFSLTELPGCCGYVVSHDSYIQVSYRKKGLGTCLNNFRIDIAKYLKYTAILCTDLDNNIGQRKILEKNKWKDIHSLTNKKTGNFLHLTVKEL